MEMYSRQEHDGKIAVISISDTEKESPFIFNNPSNGIIEQLRLYFDDVDIGQTNCITDDTAKRIVAYVLRVQGSVDKLIVHCEAGISRSAGVGAAIMKYLDDDDWAVFHNSRFRPNMICYRKVLNSFYECEVAE